MTDNEIRLRKTIENIISCGVSADGAAHSPEAIAKYLAENDVVLKDHGKWIYVKCENGNIVHKCSVCGHEIRNVPPFPNCPYCTAVMDGKHNEQLENCKKCRKYTWCNHIGDAERCANMFPNHPADPVKRGLDVWVITFDPITVRRGTIVAADRDSDKIVVLVYDEGFPHIYSYSSVNKTLFVGGEAYHRAVAGMKAILDGKEIHVP